MKGGANNGVVRLRSLTKQLLAADSREGLHAGSAQPLEAEVWLRMPFNELLYRVLFDDLTFIERWTSAFLA